VRIAEGRAPASPTSKNQIARRKRILDAAAELGARTRFEMVQMHDVAKDADVAIATLYRYFPSKHALFAAVYTQEVSDYCLTHQPRVTDDVVEQITGLLNGLSRRLLRSPTLAASMFQAQSAVYEVATMDEVEPTQSEFGRTLLRMMGVKTPDERDLSIVRLLTHCWWGALVSTLTGQTTPERAKADVRLAARLLLAPYHAAP
jgi:AcrR family transcriptional regulator